MRVLDFKPPIRKQLQLVLGITAIVLASFGWYWQHSRNSPTGIAKRYLSALQAGNFSAAYGLVASSSKKFIDQASYEQYQRQNYGDWVAEAVQLKSTYPDHVVVSWKDVVKNEQSDSHLDLVLDGGAWRIAHIGIFYRRLSELYKSKQYKAYLEVTDEMNQIAPWDGEIWHGRSLTLMKIAEGMPDGLARQPSVCLMKSKCN